MKKSIIFPGGTWPEIKKTIKEHQAADARCGRDWECACGACNIARRIGYKLRKERTK